MAYKEPYIPVIEIITSKRYYDPAKGTTRTEETSDGWILKNGGVPKHPVWLVGKRVSLTDISVSGCDADSGAAHIRGKISADRPLYTAWLTLPVYKGSPLSDSLGHAYGFDADDYEAVSEFISDLPSRVIGKDIRITGTLQLKEGGKRKVSEGRILVERNNGGLFTLEDIDVKVETDGGR